jgi:DNA-binding response OmpR family regulator
VSDEAEFTRAQQTLRRFQHEVRTPLGQIIGYSELLEEELEDRGQEDLAPDLHRIRTAAQRLLDLVDGKLRTEQSAGAPELPEQNESEAARARSETGSNDEPDASAEAALAVSSETARILVVDDDPQNRNLLSRRLERHGFEVKTARDGIEGLRCIESDDFHLVMLDVLMPGMNGLEVLERVRRSRSMSELPIILATALADTEDAIEGLQRGANDYVTKPFDFPMVVARVRTQLAATRDAREIAALGRKLEFRNSFIHQALGRDVPSDLLVELAETPGALDLSHERRIVTTLYADIQDARRLESSLAPAEYVALLRNTLGALAAVVLDQQGAIDAIAGDALTATFGLPEPAQDDTARAAACALGLVLEMAEINERNVTAGLPAVELSVGVATGPVVVGGFGAGDDIQFKAIGEPFLRSARIEADARGGEVWICTETLSRLGELAEVDRERVLDDQIVHRLLGVGGEWVISLRCVPD